MKLTVGRLAKETKINIETVRYYESIELLPKPIRTKNGYRIYDKTDIKRLIFIKKAKELGFTLKEIKELIDLKVDSNKTCGDVKNLATKKITNIQDKINTLQNIKKVLQKLVVKCNSNEIDTNECPILEVLDINKRSK